MNARKGAAAAVLLLVLGPVLTIMMLGGDGQDPCRQALTAANSPLRIGMLANISMPGYDDEQIANAAAVVRAGADLGMDRRDQTIGVMVALAESSLRALDYGDEAGPDSRGLFQQRDNGAWGTYADRMDPYTSATNFFKALMNNVPDRDSMAPTLVGNAVQGNRDPYHYESSWEAAQEIMNALDSAGQTGAGDPAPTAAAQAEAAPTAAPSASAPPAGADVVATARAQLGIPYTVGGSDPQGGFDCSGLIQYVFAQAGISLPRTAAEQGGAGEEVWSGAGASAPLDTTIRPGDIIFFPGGRDHYDHVALYVGDRTMIHAPDIGSVVSEAAVDDAYWGARQWSVRRIDAATAAASAASPARTGSRAPAGCPDDRLLLTKSLGSSAPLTPGGWAPPAAGPITSDYGMRVNPVDGGLRLHAGTDLGGGGCGGPIYAAHDGTVTLAGMDQGVGDIEIDHGGGIATAYLHMYLEDIYVHVGDRVTAGQLIALVGSSGNSTGCHLHFEVHVNGETTDPAPFMQERGVDLNGEPVGADGGLPGW